MRAKRGFSLLELMVSIVIITTLVGFIVPNVVDYFRQTRVATLQYQLRTMRSAIAKYSKDHYGAYPRSLYRLVEEGYLTEIPDDPFAGHGDSWEVAVQYTIIDPGSPFYSTTKKSYKVIAIDSDDKPFSPYNIVPRGTNAPNYDPPAGNPAVVPGAETMLFWSNQGICDVRSGFNGFYSDNSPPYNAFVKNEEYKTIDLMGFEWGLSGQWQFAPANSYYD